MLDRDGYRPNVAIVIVNGRNLVFWGKRVREHSWQFPQGGINPGEAPEQAMYRELHEEVGLQPQHVRVLGRTRAASGCMAGRTPKCRRRTRTPRRRAADRQRISRPMPLFIRGAIVVI